MNHEIRVIFKEEANIFFSEERQYPSPAYMEET